MACRLLNIVEQHVIVDDGALDARLLFRRPDRALVEGAYIGGHSRATYS
jgi:hypothetical protein